MYDEKLRYLIEEMNQSTLGLESLESRSFGVDTYRTHPTTRNGEEGRMRRIVIWVGTLIVSGILYYQESGRSIIAAAYTRPEYRRQGYAKILYRKLKNPYAPHVSTKSGKLFIESVNKKL